MRLRLRRLRLCLRRRRSLVISLIRLCEEHAKAKPWQREPVPSEPLCGDEGKQSPRLAAGIFQ